MTARAAVDQDGALPLVLAGAFAFERFWVCALLVLNRRASPLK